MSGNFIERLQYFMETYGINDNQMTIAAGLSVGLLGKLKKNGKGMNSGNIEKILSSYPNLNSEWLLTGRGEMCKTKRSQNDTHTSSEPSKPHSKPVSKEESEDKITNNTPENQTKSVEKLPEGSQEGLPLIPLSAVAGFPTIDEAGIFIESCERYRIPEFEAKGAQFLIRVSGESMIPTYQNGDIVACRKLSDILFFQWGNIYVIDSSQGQLVKRIFECPDNTDHIQCVSDNTKYPPFNIPTTDIRSLSIIVGLLRIV